MNKVKKVICALCLLIMASCVFSACEKEDLKKIEVSKISITDKFYYNGKSHLLVATYNNEVISNVSYSLKLNSGFKKSDDFLEIVGNPDEDVEYFVYFKIQLDGYEEFSSQLKVKVQKEDSRISYEKLTQQYNNTSKMFVVKFNGKVVENIKYSLTEDGEYVDDLKLVDAGVYNVFYKFKINDKEEYLSCKTLTIEKVNLTTYMFSLLGVENLTYTGEAHEPVVYIKNVWLTYDDIEISYEDNSVVGIGLVRITAKETSKNFTGSIVKAFEIKQ